MGIVEYKKTLPDGGTKKFYMVVAEAINRYSGRRVQKKRRGIPTKPKAQRIYQELWIACRDRRPDSANIDLWGDLVERYLTVIGTKIRSEENQNGFSPQLVKTKKSRLKHTLGWSKKHIDLITPHFVNDELDTMERKGSTRSHTNHILKEVKCVFAFAVELGTLKANPFAGLKMRRVHKKRKEALTHEEVDRLLSEAKLRNHPYYEVWLLTITLGLRRSELAGLKWLDVDFEQGLIYLRRQLIPGEGLVAFLKDREERVVAIPAQVVPVLKEMKLRTQTDFVIEVDCHHWRCGQQARVLREFCREIGIKEVTHHQLRATHITLALIDGVPLGIVKENVGHAKLSTTDEYFRSSGIQMRNQLDGLRVKVPSQMAGNVISLKK